MNKFLLTVSRRPQQYKPQSAELAKTHKSFNCEELTIGDFADMVAPPFSFTWSGGIFDQNKVKNANWEAQQVIGLDFDNGEKSVGEVLDFFRQGSIEANVSYYTFSDTPEHRKFRVVFFLDEPITERKELGQLMYGLEKILPIDKACKNAGRLYFGGKESTIHKEIPVSKVKLLEFVKKVVLEDIVGSGITTEELYSNNSSPDDFTLTTTTLRGDIKVDFGELRKKVKVLDKLISCERITHPEMFGLATNLKYLRGGMQLLADKINEYNDTEGRRDYYGDNRRRIVEVVNKMWYPPIPIMNFSTNEEDKDLGDIISILKRKGVVDVLYEVPKISLQEAEEKFDDEFQKFIDIPVVNNDDDDECVGLYYDDNEDEGEEEPQTVHIFKLPTAMGKTRKIQSVNNTLICVPTHQLKNEVADRMPAMPILAPENIQFKNVASQNKLETLYRVGLYGLAAEHIGAIAEGFGNNTADTDTAGEYLKAVGECASTDENVIITHKRLFLGNKAFQHSTVIIDEDPLQTLCQVKKTTLSDLFALSLLRSEVGMLVLHLKGLPDGIHDAPELRFDLKELTEDLDYYDFDTQIFDFFVCNCFIKKGNDLTYLIRKPFPKYDKMLIMSATICPEIYQKLYPKINFVVVDISNVEQAGQINQYTGLSLSRSSIGKHLDCLLQTVGELPVITFSKFKKYFPTAVEDMHFGNCAGYDTLAGRDIAVIGTPHIHESYYLLLAKAMKINFNLEDIHYNNQRIRFRNFGFMFKCFNHEEIRQIQLLSIESEMLQAVGRARTLRFDCIVELYSNFPLYVVTKFLDKKK